MKPLISNIQRFCVHDGPGIRTTVFFKGCSLHCPWCANPENIKSINEMFYIRQKCRGECQFYNASSLGKTCTLLENGETYCLYGAIEPIGRHYTEEALYKEIVKDKIYYEEEGGVTFSGGEPLLFLPCYASVLKKLQGDGISCAVETSLFVPEDEINFALEMIDIFYVDIKIVNKEKCHNIIGGNIDIFKKNLKKLNEHRSGELVYRIPIVPGYTDDEENIVGVTEIVTKYPPDKVQIFSVHNLASKKYERLNRKYTDFCICDVDRLKVIAKDIEKRGIDVEIIRI